MRSKENILKDAKEAYEKSGAFIEVETRLVHLMLESLLDIRDLFKIYLADLADKDKPLDD